MSRMPHHRVVVVVLGALVCLAAVPATAPATGPDMPATAVAATAASAVADVRWLGPDGEPLPFVGHDAALEFLRVAEIASAEEIGGSQNRPLKVLLEHDGVRAHAVFRRVNRTWQRAWIRGVWRPHLIDRARSERAAYEVARLLGFANVPPTVLRELDGEKGSLQLWIEGAEPLADLSDRRGDLPERFTEQMAAIWAFDKLIYNVDRHPGNILVGADGMLWMIDHTQAFQYDGRLPDADQVRTIPRTMWQRLRIVPEAVWAEAVADALNGSQIDAFLDRREELIGRIESLIADYGVQRVLRPASGAPGVEPEAVSS